MRLPRKPTFYIALNERRSGENRELFPNMSANLPKKAKNISKRILSANSFIYGLMPAGSKANSAARLG